MPVIVGDKVPESETVAAAYIVNISAAGRNFEELIQELAHHIVVALAETADQFGKPVIIAEEIVSHNSAGFRILRIHSRDLAVREICVEQVNVREQRVR